MNLRQREIRHCRIVRRDVEVYDIVNVGHVFHRYLVLYRDVVTIRRIYFKNREQLKNLTITCDYKILDSEVNANALLGVSEPCKFFLRNVNKDRQEVVTALGSRNGRTPYLVLVILKSLVLQVRTSELDVF